MTSGQLAEFLRRRREARFMSQTELADASGVKRDYIASIERARIRVVYPETLSRLQLVLGFPGWTALEAMGYQTDAEGSRMLPLLAAAIQRLSDAQQDALLVFLESFMKERGLDG